MRITTSVFFICENGLRRILLPPTEEYGRSVPINLTTCSDGCYVETEMDISVAVDKMNEFKGKPITWIHLDTNEIDVRGTFNGATVKISEFDNPFIYLDYSPNNSTKFQ